MKADRGGRVFVDSTRAGGATASTTSQTRVLRNDGTGRLTDVTQQIKNLKTEWLNRWMPRLTQETSPLSPYRVIWDLLHTVLRIPVGAFLAELSFQVLGFASYLLPVLVAAAGAAGVAAGGWIRPMRVS